MAKKKRAADKQQSKKHHFIVSKEKKPAVALKSGMKLEVVSVSLVDPTLKPARAVAARLCGGTSTCLALVQTGE